MDKKQYKIIAGLLLLIALGLHPGSSPLFHLATLPSMTLLHHYDHKLFHSFLPACIATVDLVGYVMYGGTEKWYTEMWTICTHTAVLAGVITGTINLQDQFVRQLALRGAHTKSLLYGIIFASMSALSGTMHDSSSITPSSARYESLRVILRYSSEMGIDLLLSISGYLVSLVLEIFMPASPEQNERMIEYIKLLQLEQHHDETISSV